MNATETLRNLLFQHDELADLDPAGRRIALRRLAADAGLDDPGAIAAVADHIDGCGPLTELMNDPGITDILVNGPDEVWVERSGCLERVEVGWPDVMSLEGSARRLVASVGGRVDPAHPIAQARLPDGSRLQVVWPPISTAGPMLAIRRFPRLRFDLDDLVERGMLTEAESTELRVAVQERATIAISGGTGSGKTTLMNALLGCVGTDERVVTIEELPELQPSCAHRVALVARPENVEGRGSVRLTELLRTSLRLRPDRIVVGEVRGPEALVALDAMSTGHVGSMVTVHARSARDVVDRMVALALQGDPGASEDSLRRRFERAFDLVVHLGRDHGARVCREIWRCERI